MQVAVVAALIFVLGTGDVAARPTVRVVAEIDAADVTVRDRLSAALPPKAGPSTAETFITDVFIEAFSVLPMFHFVSQGPPELPTLRLFVTSGPGRQRWPSRDVRIEISMAGAADSPIVMTLFERESCASGRARRCYPRPLTARAWYADRFRGLLLQWPAGLLRSVVFTTQAAYEGAGIVRTREHITEFGQVSDGAPTAMFQISYGEVQRQFAFCKQTPFGALGRDQGTSPNAVPWCIVDPPANSPPPGTRGRVTLLRALVR